MGLQERRQLVPGPAGAEPLTGLVVEIDPLTDGRWGRYLSGQPNARFCHSGAWIEILQRSFGYQPAHLAYVAGDRVLGVLPLLAIHSRLTGRRLVSLPFSGPAGPLGDSVEIIQALVDAAERRRREGGFANLNLQVRGEGQLGHRPGLNRTEPFVCSVLTLEGMTDQI